MVKQFYSPLDSFQTDFFHNKTIASLVVDETYSFKSKRVTSFMITSQVAHHTRSWVMSKVIHTQYSITLAEGISAATPSSDELITNNYLV